MADTLCHSANTTELLALKQRYLIPCVHHFYKDPPVFVAGEGAYLFDRDGTRYLDCFTGVTVMSAGHCEPAIIEPVIEQIRSLQHTTSIYLTEPVLRLAEALAEVTPGGLCRSFFCASGSEAVEGALLLAALHTGRPSVIAMINGLHGRTRWGMNVTGLDMWRTDPNPIQGVTHLSFGDLDTLEQLLEKEGERYAALIAEPIQGNGGINVPDDNYWPAVRELCNRFGVLLIFDEIQTGMNRTGQWFAGQHWGVTPDIMAVSKALGNGFPISAFITTDTIAQSYTRPGASTYGGNPVSAAAALATIRFHREHHLGDNATQQGQRLLAELTAIASEVEWLGTPRGRGLMLGCPVINSEGLPDATRMDALLEILKDLGMLVGKTGSYRNVMTLMPPLTINDDEAKEIINTLNAGVQYVS
jgi:4-aminobutyrate aminotransferase/4-aminobutyrate aminotransferase/(S)-3-amino-2-methylpropionate transaminase